jgi:hypothetical protein
MLLEVYRHPAIPETLSGKASVEAGRAVRINGLGAHPVA